MANLTIKDLSDDVYRDLKKSAAVNRRSIAAQATLLLEQALGHRPLSESKIRREAQSLRERTAVYLTENELRAAIDEGRS